MPQSRKTWYTLSYVYCKDSIFIQFSVFITDDVMGDEEDEDESDAIVNQVLDELGLQLNDKLGDAPVGTGTLAATAAAKNKTAVAAGAADDDDADLQARLDDLRRD